MVGNDVFQYAFKRAVRDLDDLVDLSATDAELHGKLRGIRTELLKFRNSQQEWIGPRAEIEPGLKEIAPRSGADFRGEVKDSEKLNNSATPAPAGLDFGGAWITENGTRVQIGPQRKDGAWEGLAAGYGIQLWDEYGRNDAPGLNLSERVREGKNYK